VDGIDTIHPLPCGGISGIARPVVEVAGPPMAVIAADSWRGGSRCRLAGDVSLRDREMLRDIGGFLYAAMDLSSY
jgi:hypothetical protein